MKSLNEVRLIGRVGADPTIKDLTNGRVANVRLATDRSWTDRTTQERRTNTQWHNIVVYDENLVAILEKHVQQGDKIMVGGELETRTYKDAQNVDKYVTEVVLSRYRGVLMVLAKKGEGSREAEEAAGVDNDPFGG